MKIGCMISIQDHALNYGTFGKAGVYHVLNKLADHGVSRVYYRSLGCGQATYPSRVTEAGLRFDLAESQYRIDRGASRSALESASQSLDYASFDHLACFRDRCRTLGLDLLIWHEARCEDHGCGLRSRFAKEHPEFLAINDRGERSLSELSWAIPEVMDRRLALFREVVAYEPDGIFFDFFKSGDTVVRRFDEDGYWATGYEPAMLDLFAEQTGRDARQIPNNDESWLRFRARFPTAYVRACRQIQRSDQPGAEIGLFAATPGANCCKGNVMRDGGAGHATLASALANLEDHQTWFAEGLLDAICLRHNLATDAAAVVDGQYEQAAAAVQAEVAEQGRDMDDQVRRQVQLCVYGQNDTHAEPWAEHVVAEAARSGAQEVVLRESCPIWPYAGVWKAIEKAARRFETVNE